MDINQTTASGTYDLNLDFVESIDFGIQLTEVNNRSAGAVVQRDAWGGVTQRGAIADLLDSGFFGAERVREHSWR